MILDYLFHFKPFICPGCKEPSKEIICESCIRSMRKNHTMIQAKTDGILGIFPVFISYSTSHHILSYWKDYSGKALRNLLFSPSKELLLEVNKIKFDLVIPIPQSEARSLKRGHASAFEVAKFFANELKLPLILGLDLKEIQIQKQANLNEWQRRFSENPFICNTFALKDQKILLVDDFITTGNTIEKAANSILELNPTAKIYAASLGWRPKKFN